MIKHEHNKVNDEQDSALREYSRETQEQDGKKDDKDDVIRMIRMTRVMIRVTRMMKTK